MALGICRLSELRTDSRNVPLTTGLRLSLGKTAVYDLETMEKRDEFTFSSPISMLCFSQDGQRLFVLTIAQTVYMLDASSLAKH